MQLEVTIKRGKVVMDVLDGQGPSCTAITEPYENRLAAGRVERVFKPEHDAGGEDHRLRVGG